MFMDGRTKVRTEARFKVLSLNLSIGGLKGVSFPNCDYM